MKQDDLSELRRLILKLVRRIATVNRAHGSARVGDIVWLQERKPGSRSSHVVDTLRLGQDGGTWVTVERDTQLWNDVVDKLHMPRKNIISRRFAETELIGLVENHRRKGWRLRGIHKSINHLLDNIAAERGEETIVFLPITGLVLNVKEFEVGDVKFIDRAELKEIDDKLQKMESELGKYVKFSMSKTIAMTKAIGDRETALQNARQKVNQTLNIFRVFVYPTVENRKAPRRQIGVMGDIPLGIITSGHANEWATDLPLNAPFVEAMYERGYLPIAYAYSIYIATATFLEAVEATGGDTSPEKLHAAWLKVKIDTPAGPISFDEQGCGIGSLYVYQWTKEGGEYYWKPIKVYEQISMKCPAIDG